MTLRTFVRALGRRRRAATLAAAAVAVLAGSTAAVAITNGQPDGDDHPYVGLMVAIDESGSPLWRCSGSLVSPTVFLTAGHCTETPAASVAVWFDEGPVPFSPDFGQDPANPCAGVSGYPCTGDASGAPHAHPDFCIGCGKGLPGFVTRDVGLVVLDEPVPTSLVGEYAELPTLGLVETLPNRAGVDFVGYGVQFQAQIPGNLLPQPPPFYRWAGPRQRLFATATIVPGNFVHSADFIRVSESPGRGSGGTCFGDSGGPALAGGTDTVLAVTSYGANVNCAGVGYYARIDTPAVLTWIESFLG